jgi:aryl-alcohol dehydrogenase-like predicted oxidoreductase
MQTRRLGRTEHRSSIAIYGGAALWDADEERARQSFEAAIAAGVNHLDVAPQYGKAEELLGPLVAEHRSELFVAAKTLRHKPDGVRAQLETTLERLCCEQLDLYQLHAVTDLAELDRRSGAIEAIQAARDEGLCRFVGITGHETSTARAQIEALRRYDLDTVMLPINPRMLAEADYAADLAELLELAAQRDVGVMAIKAGAARPWEGRPTTASTWYEPYTTKEELSKGIRFALSQPQVAGFCKPGDVEVARLANEAALEFVPMGMEEARALVAERAAEPLNFPMAGA